MKQTPFLAAEIASGGYDSAFSRLYPGRAAADCRERYLAVIAAFEALYGPREAVLISAPGRTEVGGNHTDHQQGCVLAAAVDLDVLCVAAPNGEGVIRLRSAGYSDNLVTLGDLSPQREENSTALIRGVAQWFADHGHTVGGFDAYAASQVLGGSGLSSSAAFEVAVGQALSVLFNGGGVSPIEIAMAGRYAENHHFGKPCGLMDQMASSVGGFVGMDFARPEAPQIRPMPFDLRAAGYRLCIVNCGGSHAALTPEYAAIPAEMGQAAAFFGKAALGQVDETLFWAQLPRLRQAVGDRPLLRAMHFFGENRRAAEMASRLEEGDFPGFLELVRASGRSSWQLLQNVIHGGDPRRQELGVALALSEKLLAGEGACRVHGGGFAGTIQAFVPEEALEEYRRGMEAVFGAGACHLLSVRPAGGTQVLPLPQKEG